MDSLARVARDSFEVQSVLVIDNASSDESVEGLSYPGLPLRIIRNLENRGFAAACNQATRMSSAEYILFLNPDTVVFQDSLGVPLQFMEQKENSQVGMCGIQLVDENGHIAKSCSRFPTAGVLFGRMLALDRVFPSLVEPQMYLPVLTEGSSLQVDHMTAAFILVRRVVFEEVGLFDERFFVYLDDLDLSLRFEEHGYRSYYLTSARARHGQGKCAEYAKATSLFYFLRSRILYAWKHFSVTGGMLVFLGTICVEPVSRAARAVFRGSVKELRETVGAYAKLWRELPRLLPRRS